MKFLIVLALVVSCSTKNSDTKPAAEPVATNDAVESDAKPVSPYTVQPCYCMKIFKPVCAGGVNYGNSCEAECNGHKTWTDGRCTK